MSFDGYSFLLFEIVTGYIEESPTTTKNWSLVAGGCPILSWSVEDLLSPFFCGYGIVYRMLFQALLMCLRNGRRPRRNHNKRGGKGIEIRVHLMRSICPDGANVGCTLETRYSQVDYHHYFLSFFLFFYFIFFFCLAFHPAGSTPADNKGIGERKNREGIIIIIIVLVVFSSATVFGLYYRERTWCDYICELLFAFIHRNEEGKHYSHTNPYSYPFTCCVFASS